MPSSQSALARTTVGSLRRQLERLNDDDAIVVVGTGFGYEEPLLHAGNVRAVLVPHRYVHEPGGDPVYVLRPWNANGRPIDA